MTSKDCEYNAQVERNIFKMHLFIIIILFGGWQLLDPVHFVPQNPTLCKHVSHHYLVILGPLLFQYLDFSG